MPFTNQEPFRNGAPLAASAARKPNASPSEALTGKAGKESHVMAKQSRRQKQTVERVMHEFKHGELRSRGTGPKVRSRKQAVAIALHEAGASKYESPKKNRENLRKTKTKERRGETGKARAEGKKTARHRARGGSASGKTRAELYEQAKRRNIPGRSKMSKGELERALRR
jgi:hypothetical protein